jgi:hypothetical protein
MCQSIVKSINDSYSRYQDEYRKNVIRNLTTNLHFRGIQVSAKDVYDWISQFNRIADDPGQRPWDIGLTIVSAIAGRYFFDYERIASLWNIAFSQSATFINYNPQNINVESNKTEILLIDPETGINSSQTASRFMFMLLRQNADIKLIKLSCLLTTLKNKKFNGILICSDDFVGTGSQINEKIIEPIMQALKESSENYKNNPLNLVLLFAIGYEDALENLRHKSTPFLTVFALAGSILNNQDRAFTSSSTIFTNSKIKKKAKRLLWKVVGKSLYPDWPDGFGHCQSLVILMDNTPDDTLPAISYSGLVKGFSWKALFERIRT